ncbi:MAG: DUF1559 domain-containing protein [Verrucomicrobiota bacterium]|nr:DUF1559 domain-containing protein [Limisphaera sp.]MDW8382500.1 DUF1559 domain-containing protein [Verrucomicrobiota bacterium]
MFEGRSIGRRSGFTLVELIVVLAVIALLVGLLLPALGRAAARGRQAACMNHLRQIGIAMQLYADDHGGWLPTTTHGRGSQESWIFQLSDYLAGVDRIRICPSDPKGPARRSNQASSYVLNEFVFVDLLDPFGRVLESRRRLQTIPKPAQTMTAMEIADGAGAHVLNDHAHSRRWDQGWPAVLADIQPDRHEGSANYLFADAHVEAIAATKLRARLEAGDNPARPPR